MNAAPIVHRLSTDVLRTGVGVAPRSARRCAGVPIRPAAIVALLLSLLACPRDDGTTPPRTARVGDVDLAYRTFGPPAGTPILFILGVGGEMPAEPDGFLRPLVEAGRRVIVYDNRDAGASTHFERAGAPRMDEIAAAMESGAAPPLPYTLDDMAGDAVGLLDALGVDRAHLVGGSAGGMIALLVAATHPERVASLTLVSSSTNGPGLPQGSPPGGPGDAPDPVVRQSLAVGLAGDLGARAARVVAPTVVVHGSRDAVLPPAHGRALADAIPGARLLLVDGMGHVPEEEHAPAIARAVESVVARAGAAP